MNGMLLQEAMDRFALQTRRSKSANTSAAYLQALQAFVATLRERDVDPEATEIAELAPEWLDWYLEDLQYHSVATERLYSTAVHSFYKFCAGRAYATVNLARVEFILEGRRRQGRRLPVFPEDGVVEVVSQVEALAIDAHAADAQDYVILLRDAALLLTLADTGLRVSEACALRHGDVDWEQRRAVIVGKGDKQAIVRFSGRAVRALQRYLWVRRQQASKRGRIAAWPLFARHDRAAGSRILPISPRTVQKIVDRYVRLVLGEDAAGTITPHTFRHYFVTRIARQHGLLLAQHLARHESVGTTERYAHLADEELDQAYAEVFESVAGN
jgi:integrase/recombinase XerC